MTFSLAGIGTVVPEVSVLQSEAAKAWASLTGVGEKKGRTVQALYRKSGVRKRHSVLLGPPGEDGVPNQTFFHPVRSAGDPGPTTQDRMARFELEGPPLAKESALLALERASLSPADITHLITVSCTGFFAPGIDTALIDLLDLPATVERTHVGFMGCHGSLNGLRVAAAFGNAQRDARVLVSSVELCTLHMSYDWDPDLLVANSLFGDGAAAVVGIGGETDDGSDAWRLADSGTCRLPGSSEAMSWRIGDHGFRMTLSASVPEIIERHLKDWVQRWLAGSGLALEDISTWAVHPGGPRILTSVAGALGLSPGTNDVAEGVLADYGNMSSATILFILERLREQGAPRPCVALAFGPGLVAEATLFL